MTAGIILAIMITPIITSLSREVIATVPAAQREAAYGMGATRWEMIRHSVLPWSRGGIIGAVMLGLGRAMGETIAVALVIGSTAQITSHVFCPGDSMAAVIANQFGEAGGAARSALIGLGVVLFVITIIVNVVARGIVARIDRRLRGRDMPHLDLARRSMPADALLLLEVTTSRSPPRQERPGHGVDVRLVRRRR